MSESLKQWAPLPLRLIIGFGFIYHGFPKISAEGHQTFVATLSRIHVPAPGLMAWVAGVVEFVGGIALILGIFVTIDRHGPKRTDIRSARLRSEFAVYRGIGGADLRRGRSAVV